MFLLMFLGTFDGRSLAHKADNFGKAQGNNGEKQLFV